ncbi:MAG: site-2 protease family protein [Clostridia bacterium]|nr:site-2 protease family protein [Clostridia bacterium]
MLLDLFRSDSYLDLIIKLMARVFVVFCTLPIHEFAHALTADRLGDDTPRLKGRLTLNPLAHLNLLGSLMIFLVGFGYAEPVPVNPRNFKNPRGGMAITAAAGPLSNLVMALFFALVTNASKLWVVTGGGTLASVCFSFFYFAAVININLAVFNLIPVPPLDGSRILNLIIPAKYYFAIMKYERYIMIGVLVILFTGILSTPLAFLSSSIMRGFMWLTGLPFNLVR